MKSEVNGQLLLFQPEIKATPILKWVGGKQNLRKLIVSSIPKTCTTYIEPFLGGASVLLEAIAQRPDMKFIASDVNRELINCYQCLQANAEAVIDILKTFKYEEGFYYSIREWDRELNWTEKKSPIKRAARLIYLNKCCFNGLQRVNSKGQNNVGFGGVHQSGNFIDEAGLKAFARAVKSVCFYTSDWCNFVEKATVGDFIYCDPPYDKTFTAYSGKFQSHQQELLAEELRKASDRGVCWIASNSDTEFVRSLYSGFKVEQIQMARSISCNGDRTPVFELLISNF